MIHIKGDDQKRSLADLVSKELADTTSYRELHWEGTFADYLKMLETTPLIARNAYQRLHDMIVSHGVETAQEEGREKVVRYKFFNDPFTDGKDAVFGLEENLVDIVNTLNAAAHGYGPEKRILLLHGPVGSAKSTIARLMKHGLEAYSQTPEGALYTLAWKVPGREGDDAWEQCPMHEEPLKLLPQKARKRLLAELNKRHDHGYEICPEGDLCPSCRDSLKRNLERSSGDLSAVLRDAVKIQRLVLSEKDRVGVGSFQPKDEKNQDSSELTGDINYRKIAEYGKDSDPRAFNFDGEFCVGNRGLVEFVEVLKLDVAFLYDLLGASQEHVIKPKKFSQTDIDLVIIAHTNEPEYRKLTNNEFMEAFRDRTLKTDIPYNLALDNEIRIYERDFNKGRVTDRHIAPHTIELAAKWAVATRLEEPKNGNLSIMQKLKLYNNKTLPGYTKDTVKELRAEGVREGLEGVSPRYIQDKLSNALVKAGKGSCVNPFMVLNELEQGLGNQSLITSEKLKTKCVGLLAEVKVEYDTVIQNEVQKAICADEDAISRMFGNYVDNVKAYTTRQKIRNKFTGQEEPPDERLMRSIEEKMDIPEGRKDDFRREVMNTIGAMAVEGKKFDYKMNERLQGALELKLFDDQKDTIKLTSLVTGVVDKATQEKIDIVKSRLIKTYGYCDICATDVLQYAASIFARKEQHG